MLYALRPNFMKSTPEKGILGDDTNLKTITL
jgi:hypothetical protein